jgi:twitching motility protein PilI
MQATKSPFEIILELNEACSGSFVGLPSQEEYVHYWQGIGFKIGPFSCISSIDEIIEILPEMSYTNLPGLKPWVKGLANVRGRLVPVVDLVQFLGIPHTGNITSRKLLIVEFQNNLIGLVVSEVMGLYHLSVMEFSETIKNSIDSKELKEFIVGAFDTNSKEWLVFGLLSLFKNSDFLNISLIAR